MPWRDSLLVHSSGHNPLCRRPMVPVFGRELNGSRMGASGSGVALFALFRRRARYGRAIPIMAATIRRLLEGTRFCRIERWPTAIVPEHWQGTLPSDAAADG